MFEIFHLLGTCMYIHYGCDSSDHYKGITMIPHILGVVLLCIIMSAFAVDCGVTVTTILKFNKRLKVMDEMAAKIHKLSDEIGENIYENVTTAVEKSEEFQETHEELLTKFLIRKKILWICHPLQKRRLLLLQQVPEKNFLSLQKISM